MKAKVEMVNKIEENTKAFGDLEPGDWFVFQYVQDTPCMKIENGYTYLEGCFAELHKHNSPVTLIKVHIQYEVL